MTGSKSKLALFDTNVLVYAINKASPFHLASRNLINKGLKGEVSLCLCPQILKEFFSVVTNPQGRIEKPLKPEDALEGIKKLLSSENIIKIYPKQDTLLKTMELLKKYNLRGRKIFDCQLVATMLSNGITKLYTFNQKDFLILTEIKAEILKE